MTKLPEPVLDSILDEIRELVSKTLVVPVVGAGISRAVAGIPGWCGILERGLQHIQRLPGIDPKQIETAQACISKGQLVEAARQVKHLLQSRQEYGAWLTKTFDTVGKPLNSTAPIERIADLLCPLVATTNYDRLLSTVLFQRPAAITWREPNAMQSAVQEGGKVFHMHGVFDDPDSVIFGDDDYRVLAEQESYKAIMRVLWLSRRMLFVGCSFNGLTDPDFIRLLQWAMQTFGKSPHKHYALIPSEEYNASDAARSLSEWRLELVPFGERSALPGVLEKLNPNPTKAYITRAAMAAHIIAAGDEAQLSRLEPLLRSLGHNREAHTTDYAGIAQTLFRARSSANKELHKELRALQRLGAATLDFRSLNSVMEQAENGGFQEFSGAFRDNALRATAVLRMASRDLLFTLERRGVRIHDNVINGYCQRSVAELEEDVEAGQPTSHNRYQIENATRLLRSLDALLRAEPDLCFPLPTAGTVVSSPPTRYLIIARSARVELRPMDSPDDLAVFLRAEGMGFLGAEAVDYGGARVVAAYSNENVLFWNPGQSNGLLGRFTLQGPGHICGAAYASLGKESLAVVATSNGRVIWLNGVEVLRECSYGSGSACKHLVLLPGATARCFAVSADRLVRLPTGTNGRLHPCLAEKQILEAVSSFKPFQPYWSRLVASNTEAAEHLGLGSIFSRPFEVTGLGWRMWRGRPVLLVIATAIFQQEDRRVQSFVLLVEPEGQVLGYFHAEQEITSCDLFEASPSDAYLCVGLITNFRSDYDQVIWARATSVGDHVVFQREGSLLPLESDVVSVVLHDLENLYVTDFLGHVYLVSIKHRHCRQIDLHDTYRVNAVCVEDTSSPRAGCPAR